MYFIKLRAKFLVWLMQTRFYLFLLRYVLPNLKLLQAPGPGYSVKQDIRKLMRPGDILVSKSKFALTNWIIGGQFSHAAVVVDNGFIAEMTNRDFDLVDVNHFSEGTTRIALLRFKDGDALYGGRVAMAAMSLAHSKYDTRFTLGVEALYCSELAYQADIERRMNADLSDLVGLGVPYLSPDGVYDASGLTVLYEWTDYGW